MKNHVGRIVLQSRNGVNRYGVVTFQRVREDKWTYITILWFGSNKNRSPSEWLNQIEWRIDAIDFIDASRHMEELADAIRFRDSRKFREETKRWQR